MNRNRLPKRVLGVAGAVFVAALALPLSGQHAETPPAGAPAGYLGASMPDESVFLPPPPADKSAAGKADLAAFRATRSQRGTARWRLAASDDAVDPVSMLRGFGCALGVELKPGDAPALERLIQRALMDAVTMIGPPKDRYHRERPFLRARGEICIDRSPHLAASGSYPSGHATVGWLDALILAELAPDRAAQVLARGRSFGESRVVCGVHYPSDLEAGHVLASGLFATMEANADFQADLAAARVEFERLRHTGTAGDTAQCAIESEASATRPW
jgi:acid phosphatase (class A)